MIRNNVSLTGEDIWLKDDPIKTKPADIQTCRRIGVEYASEDAKALSLLDD